MCLQCITEAEIFGKSTDDCEIFPGWILTRATKDSHFGEWKKGEYGLVRCNDPDLVLSCEILPAPEDWGNDESDTPEYAKYFDNVAHIAEALNTMDFSASIALLSALRVNIHADGLNSFDIAEMLMERMHAHTEKHPARSIDEWERISRSMTEEQWELFKESAQSDGK